MHQTEIPYGTKVRVTTDFHGEIPTTPPIPFTVPAGTEGVIGEGPYTGAGIFALGCECPVILEREDDPYDLGPITRGIPWELLELV